MLFRNCSFIIFAKVTYVDERVSEGNNEYGVKEGNLYYLVDIDKP